LAQFVVLLPEASTYTGGETDCTLTNTETAAASGSLSGDGTLSVLGNGQGSLQIAAYLDDQGHYVGMSSLEASGDQGCEGAEPSPLTLTIGTFVADGEPSTSTFSGSADQDQPSLFLPNGDYAKFHFSWSLRLVRR
jgi:hypothetical protein